MKQTSVNSQNCDWNIVWKDVYYAPSPACIQQRLRENSMKSRLNKLQHERNLTMYELFGGGKSQADKISKRKPLGEIDIDSDPNETKERLSNRESKDSKLQHSKRGQSLNKGYGSETQEKKPFVAISNLDLFFQENRPQLFFGIRKPRTFDNVVDKEPKEDILKPNVTVESIFDLFVPFSSDMATKTTRGRHSSQLSFSSRAATYEINEIRDRFNTIAKSAKGGSVHDDVMDIMNKIKQEAILDKQRLVNLAGFYKITFPDINDKVGRQRILNLFVNKYYRENHPKHNDIMKEVNETPNEKIIMKNCILNNKMLTRILKNHSFYSHKYRLQLAEIDFKLASNEDYAEKAKQKKVTVPTSLPEGVGRQCMNILDDMCSHCKEFNGFYRPLYEHWCDSVIDEAYYYGDIEPRDVKHAVQSLSKLILSHRNIPGSGVLALAQQLLRNGINNSPLLLELCTNVEGWFDQVLKSLVSKYSSIRLECFITVCYVVSKKQYIDGINANFFNDTFYDLVATIIRCMDLKPEEFSLYYSLLGVVFHFVPSQILLDCLLEKAPYSNNQEMVSKWPKFVYLAVKYWPSETFNSSQIYLKRVIEKLENHYLREILSRKALKLAISCISKRFNVKSDMFAVWPRFVEHFPD